MTQSIHARGATRLQRLLDILSHVRNIVDLSIHRGAAIALAIARFYTRVDLCAIGDAFSGRPIRALREPYLGVRRGRLRGRWCHVSGGPDLVGSLGPFSRVHLLGFVARATALVAVSGVRTEGGETIGLPTFLSRYFFCFFLLDAVFCAQPLSPEL